MKKELRYEIKFLFLLLLLLTSAKVYSQVEPQDIIDRVNRSSYIFEGEVIRSDAYWNQAHDYIYTSITIDIKKLFRADGNLSCGTVEMILLGGRVGDDELEISHNLVLGKGARGVFLTQLTNTEQSAVDFYPETNTIVLQPTDGEQGFIRYYFDNINPEVVDYWQFQLDSVAQVYNMMDLYNQIHYTDCYPPPLPLINSNSNFLSSSVDTSLTVTLENPVITTHNGIKSFAFDVSLSDNMDSIYFLSATIRIQYDTNTFFTFMDTHTKIHLSTNSLLSDPLTYLQFPPVGDYSNHEVDISASTVATNPGTHAINLTSTSTPAIHVIMEIKDCSVPDSLIQIPIVSPNLTRYSTNPFPDSTNQHHYNSQVLTNNIYFAGCGTKYISSILPNNVRAGVGDTVTITGLGFGATRGNGNVYLKNADDGGKCYLHLDSIDYLPNGWSNTEIKFTVPSYVDSANSNLKGACPGSGFVKIKNNNGDSINDVLDYLTIRYGITSYRYNDTLKAMLNLSANDSGVFLFRTDPSFSSYSDKLTCLKLALKQWRCITTVNFRLGTDTLIPNDTFVVHNSICQIKFGYSRDSASIAFTQQWKSYSFGPCNKGFTKEVDIVVNKLFIPFLFSDTDRTIDVPNGKYDFYSILLHELGHAHSLTHVIDTNEIMYYGQIKTGILAAKRKIFLMDSPNAVDAGDFILDSSRAINFTLCDSMHLMAIGVLNCTTIGVNEINKPNINLNIYPNPTYNLLNINYDVEKYSKVDIKLIDLTGRPVYSNSFYKAPGNYSNEIRMQSFDNGYYLLYLSISDHQYAGKIIKQ